MKNFIFLAVILLCVSTPSRAYPASADQPYRLPDPVSKEYKSIHYTVLPQIELISIIQTISDYPKFLGFLMQKDSCQYKQEVLDYFGPLKNHPLVAWFNRVALRPGKMNFSAPSNLMLYADNHLNIRADLQFDPFVLSRACGRDSLIMFFDLLKDFAVQSSFNEFYERHMFFYRTILANTTAQLDSIDHIKELEAFYGTKQKSYNIVLVSLYSHVGFGNSIVYLNGEREMFDTMGPQTIKNDLPFFGDTLYLKYMTRHEFSHPFVNPLTEKHWERIKSYATNYNSIPEAAKKHICGDWQECINESLIRAVTVHIAFLESKEAGSKEYHHEKSRGISYLDPLLAALQNYADHRKQYPTFDSFYPNVLEVFKK